MRQINPITSIFLGIIQGLTEFLPISSSGHLVLFQNLLGFQEPELLLDVSLHLGTLLAVCLYFHSDLKYMLMETWKFTLELYHSRKSLKHINESPYASLALWVLVGTLPTSLTGIAFRPSLENFFGSITVVGTMLVFLGFILATTKLMSKDYQGRNEVGLLSALAVGTAQGIALIPGISRSGTTIVCGIMCGLSRDFAARFSFLLSIPAVIGALVLLLSSEGWDNVALLPLVTGFISSALVGLTALKILMGMVRKGHLFYFAPYCWALGLFIVLS
ncbi:MAG: undecaprenyl-diphosphate phosphatase [Desulfatiglandales bacterium]|nr:undecaprenyl-diphosphate phosphatase [Desulfatiglandales bacterium]